MKEKDFIELFNRIKTEEKGRKAVARGLSDKDNRELKKIIKRGFTVEEIEGAARQMFRDPSQWAISTGNDIPTHFLRPENFERYFNSFLNFKEEEEKKEEEKTKREEEKTTIKNVNSEEVFFNNSKKKYLQSLEAGEWLGDIYEARVIGPEFSEDFSKRFKYLLFQKAIRINKRESKTKNHLELSKIIEFIGRSAEGLFCLFIVQLAVKKRIFKNW